MRPVQINVLYLCLIASACAPDTKTEEEEANVAPTLDSIEIIPATEITTSTELLCRATASDENDDQLELSYSWTNAEGGNLGEGIQLELTPDNVAPGTEITCTATITDGIAEAIQGSATVSVDNTLPTIDSLSITPNEDIKADSTLICEATGSDADTEDIVWSYAWTNDTENLGDTAELTLSADTVNAGDSITCTATATDASGGSVSETESVTVENSLPVIGSLAITPDDPRVNDTLTCTAADVTDIDEDTVEIAYVWTIDGAEAGDGTNTLAGPFAVDSVIDCTATPNDGVENGQSLTTSVMIGNTAPVVDSVVITPDTNVEADTLLQCSQTATDVDGDTLTLTYAWTDGLSNALGTGDSLQLSAGIIGVGDTVICTATADDGVVTTSNTASVTIDNTAPTVTASASIAPTAVYTGEEVVCSAAIDDLNDGALTVTYEWTNAAGDVISTTANYTVDAAETNPEEEIGCTASAADYQGLSASSSAVIAISNTAPEISAAATITATPDTATGSTLTCEASFTDLDDGALSTTYEWTNAAGDVIGTTAAYTIDAQNTNPEEAVTCTASATDAQGSSISSAASIDITNTAPEISAAATITATPDTATGSTLTCEASFTDLDDGVLSTTYEWTNAAGDVIGTTADYVINASETEPGESLTCTATGTDGQSASISSAASSTVVNTAPTAPTISISGGNGFVAEDDLVCTVDVAAADVDGQALHYVYEWTDAAGNSVALSTETTALNNTLSANASGLGDWTCSVYATDGTAMSASVSATFTLDYAINARSPGDLIITEVMQNPDVVSDGNGEWFEVYNKTADDINLLGLMITDTGHCTTVDQTVIIPAGGYAVLGNNADTATNGDIAIDYEYSLVSLNNSGDQFLSIGNANGDLDGVTWGDALSMYTPNGSSMTLSIDGYSDTDNDNILYWCESITEMANGDRGTPGAENETCDSDNDGVYFAEDCDDEDSTVNAIANDADCDGTVTASDCDDNDANSETTATDADCDGILTADDCDDNDATSETIATDADCDGILTADDCDDNDAASTAISTDADCDGVLTADDCNDNNPALFSDCIGCADGTREGFIDIDAYPDIATCEGSWSGLISSADAESICDTGWHVCDASDTALRSISFGEAIAFSGCYAINAAHDHGNCNACTPGISNNDMGGLGSGCGFQSSGQSSCLSSGRIDVVSFQNNSCYYQPGQTDGVTCCRD